MYDTEKGTATIKLATLFKDKDMPPSDGCNRNLFLCQPLWNDVRVLLTVQRVTCQC